MMKMSFFGGEFQGHKNMALQEQGWGDAQRDNLEHTRGAKKYSTLAQSKVPKQVGLLIVMNCEDIFHLLECYEE